MADDNMTLYIDPETRDLVLGEDGVLQTITGDETTAQAVRLTLQVWKEEWPLDITHGTDYKSIMGKKPHELEPDEQEEVFREAIFQEDAVKEIESLEISTEGRGLSVLFHGVLSNGKKISTEVRTG